MPPQHRTLFWLGMIASAVGVIWGIAQLQADASGCWRMVFLAEPLSSAGVVLTGIIILTIIPGKARYAGFVLIGLGGAWMLQTWAASTEYYRCRVLIQTFTETLFFFLLAVLIFLLAQRKKFEPATKRAANALLSFIRRKPQNPFLFWLGIFALAVGVIRGLMLLQWPYEAEALMFAGGVFLGLCCFSEFAKNTKRYALLRYALFWTLGLILIVVFGYGLLLIHAFSYDGSRSGALRMVGVESLVAIVFGVWFLIRARPYAKQSQVTKPEAD